MFIETKTVLTEEEKQAVRGLERSVHQYDGTFRSAYLSNQFNVYPDMEAFYLGYEDDQLIGFIFIDADNPDEATLFVYVHPDHRQKRVASALIAQAKQQLEKYRIQSCLYKTEHAFLEKNTWLLDKFSIDDERELLMNAENQPGKPIENQDLEVKEATSQDIEEIALFQANVFDERLEEARRYAEESIKDPQIIQYIFRMKEQIVGSAAISYEELSNYFFGLAVRPENQNQGIGTAAISLMMTDLNQRNTLPFQLSVVKDNHRAIAVYEKNGFEIVSEILYLKN
ncbi:MAG TPA: hypothetical protein DCZ00_06285 [Lactococcus sp.]|uniref:GNAT family N-acetyltransferase n=1 Tax=Lactococcus TaxID=1357 RepID=UPI000E801192|nr:MULTISPECIES: GNAT family N-acetyltransferase [Lactococcus]HAP14817.1 hypothetical protein [Lactococcus sp.]HBC91035.1 hypothetical protein [Lactococcus sp.]